MIDIAISSINNSPTEVMPYLAFTSIDEADSFKHRANYNRVFALANMTFGTINFVNLSIQDHDLSGNLNYFTRVFGLALTMVQLQLSAYFINKAWEADQIAIATIRQDASLLP